MSESSDAGHELLEERVARLSISIGSRAAAAKKADDREMIFANARELIVEEFVKRGLSPNEAALISDDVITGARKIVAELIVYGKFRG